jgi:alpha-beta hydrolase superfamily lysophospholipase
MLARLTSRLSYASVMATVAVFIAVGGSAAGAHAALPVGPPAASFYDVPASVPARPPGTVFRASERQASPGTRFWVVLYHSRSRTGRDVIVSGVVVVPTRRAPHGGFPIVSFGHGTTGFTDESAPSRTGDTGTALPFGKLSPFLVSHGYAWALTDYEGLGTPGPLQYDVGISAGHSVLDIARAARHLAGSSLSRRVAVFGHSEGGHAALWAGQLARSYAADLDVRAVVASAPGADLAAVGRLRDYAPETTFGVLGLLGSWHEIFGAPLEPLLTPAGINDAAQIVADHSDQVDLAQPPFLAWPSPAPAPWAQLLRENTPGERRTAAPILLLVGTADHSVPPATNIAFAKKLRMVGDHVQLEVLQGADHDHALLRAKATILRFLHDRLGGR